MATCSKYSCQLQQRTVPNSSAHLGRARQVLLAMVLRHLLTIVREGGQQHTAAGEKGVAEVLAEAFGHLRGSEAPVDRAWTKIVADGLELSEGESRGEVASDVSGDGTGSNKAIVSSDFSFLPAVDGRGSRGRRGGGSRASRRSGAFEFGC